MCVCACVEVRGGDGGAGGGGACVCDCVDLKKLVRGSGRGQQQTVYCSVCGTVYCVC